MCIFLHHMSMPLNVCILILMDDPYATLAPIVESLKQYYKSMSFEKWSTAHGKTIEVNNDMYIIYILYNM